MAMHDTDHETIADEMVFCCTDAVDRKTAIAGIRAVCRYFGGQLLYMPIRKTSGEAATELRLVLCDAVGDIAADRIMGKLMALYGGNQLYIPMEKNAFRRIIAREIFERYDGNKEKIRDLCREYGMSFSQVYRLWIEGRNDKNQMQLDF
jgi:Mor family transcriptional regulator